MKRIAIIDDSKEMLDMVSRALSNAGFQVLPLLEPNRPALTDQGPPDLVLLDINMPQAFGDDIVTLLKDVWEIEAPVYLHSQIDEEELRQRAQEAGADGYISKNWGIETLVSRVQGLLAG
jgi:DNA-binding response OmpR family regulator